MFSGHRRRSREERNGFVKAGVVKEVFVYMCLRDFFALKPFHDYSSCSVCILPQLAFYSQSTVCSLHTVFILPLVRSPQSAVRNLRFTLTDLKSTSTNGLNFRIIISLMQSWRVRVESKYTHSSYGLIRITTTE